MKKLAYLLIVLSLVLALVPAAAFAHTAGDPSVTNLIAGQHTHVGDVLVWNDGGYLYVKYVITKPFWCLTETHLDIQIDSANFPKTKKGNPIPGHFAYNDEHNCVGSFKYQIPLTWAPGDIVYIAAHAAVEGPSSVVVYGSRRSSVAAETGDVYAIDLSTMSATIAGDWEGAVNAPNYPNGNAYDPVNERVYLTDPNEVLHFLDLSDSTFYSAGGLATGGSVASGAWYGGKFYYIPQGTDDLHEVSVDGDGLVTGDIKLCDFTNGSKSFSFGDIVFNSAGLILGSGNSGTGEYFTIDISNGCSYTFGAAAQHKQLAFSGRTLFGHDANSGDFYIINPSDWSESPIGTVSIEGVTGPALFTDLASGPTKYQTETAWGSGTRFVEKGNWATYFGYTVQELVCPSIVDMSSNMELLSSPPTDVNVGAYENDDFVRIWKEFEGPLPLDLEYDLDEGQGARDDGPAGTPSIAAGEYVCSYYVHLDNVGPSSTVQHTGWVEFDTDVLGLIISGGNLGTFAGRDLMFTADVTIGYEGTLYPNTSGTNYWRGFDVHYGGNLDDAEFNGSRVDFTMWVVNAHDSMRIILPIVWQ